MAKAKPSPEVKDPPEPHTPGGVVLRDTLGCTECSYDGAIFLVVDGYVEVPEAARKPLEAHGFVLPD